MYVEVSIPIALFKTFTYIVPKKYKNQIFLGQSIVVPFNKKIMNGFIVQIKSKNRYKGKLLKIQDVNHNSFTLSNELWKTVNWISRYYICPIGTVLNNTIAYQHKKEYRFPSIEYVQITQKGKEALYSTKYKAQKKILAKLNKIPGSINIKELQAISSSYIQVCKKLEQSKYILLKSVPNIEGILKIDIKKKRNLILSEEQKKIYKKLIYSLEKVPLIPTLLSGISASGKTIVYTKIIESYLKKKKQIIVLVPEVSLIQKTFNELNIYYPNMVGIWHSKLSQSEKNYILEGIKSNDLKIMVATRSGIFMPFSQLGLIIVDEEQENSYKQDLNTPYYHAKDVALMRAKFSKSSILLVSSSPSLETYYNVKKGTYHSYELKNTYFKNQYPEIKLVDMLIQKGILSRILINSIKDTLDKKEQIILLQNKKGISGSGIQKIENILYKFFPAIKILRYDGNIISRKGEYYNILNKFKEHQADILIGTQFLAKGLDFKNVSLIAMINADIGLSIPDFRSEERIFQLIYQLIGRTFHSNKKPTVIIQSYSVDNFYIQNACKQEIEKSYNSIMKERKELYYPPYSRLIKILFTGKNSIKTQKKSKTFFSNLNKNKNIMILGPSPAPIEYLNGYWRYQILIKCKKTYWQKFHNWINANIPITEFENQKKSVKIKIDVDTTSIL